MCTQDVLLYIAVEGMGMFTGKEKDKAGQHTLSDQGALHYSACSL